MKEINSLDTKIESLNLEQIKVEEKCKGFKESIKKIFWKLKNIMRILRISKY